MEFSVDRKPPSKGDIDKEQHNIKKEMILFSIQFFLPLLLYICANIRFAQNYVHNIPIALGIFMFMIFSVTIMVHVIFEKRIACFQKSLHGLSAISSTAVYYTLSMCRHYSPLDEYRKKVEASRDLTFGEYVMMKKWTEDLCKKAIEPFWAVEAVKKEHVKIDGSYCSFQPVHNNPVSETIAMIGTAGFEAGFLQGDMAY
ncbi:MAG: hypothetical protein KJ737_00120 [Proteobacteria bacterium]|nr:hypothetical protein [Pseudomonadota bacterium]